MERSAIRDLVLAAGVGLLLGANMAWGYLALTQVREELARIVLLVTVVGLVAFARARGGHRDGPATIVSSIRAHSRAAASRPPARRIAP